MVKKGRKRKGRKEVGIKGGGRKTRISENHQTRVLYRIYVLK